MRHRKTSAMKKSIASLCAAAALVLPVASAAPAAAGEPSSIVKITDCPPGYQGYMVWAWNEKRGWYEVASFCIPWGPQ